MLKITGAQQEPGETMQFRSVPRIHKPSAQQFQQECIQANRPVVLTGLLDDWPALAKWGDIQYLRAKGGSQTVELRNMNPTGTSFTRKVTLDQYLDEVASNQGALQEDYLADLPLAAALPGLVDDLGPLECCQADLSDMVVLMGRRTYAPLHFHKRVDTISAQIVGRKKFILFDPAESKNLYPNPWYSILYHFSRMDLRTGTPDPEHRTRYSRAQGWEVTLSAGECLYIPVHFWHVVYGDPEFNLLVVAPFLSDVRRWHSPYPGYAVHLHQRVPKRIQDYLLSRRLVHRSA